MTKPSSPDLLNLEYGYGTQNNGQIRSIKYNTAPGVEDQTKTQNYEYDAWLRIKKAYTTDLVAQGTWRLEWDYDRFGNRRNQTLTGGNTSITQPQLSISETTNRITDAGYAYDAAGNMTNDSLHTYTYDAQNRIKTVDGTAATYTYDSGPLRVKKVAGGSTTVYIFSGSKVLAEYVNGALSKEYVYAGSTLLATVAAGGATTYQYPDHLSTRVEADDTGAVTRTFGHYPFGETWYESGTASKLKFTTYERDSESALDNAIFRSYSSRLGRFTAPDPLAGNTSVPQSLNRYAYVLNSPTHLIDPLGLQCAFYVWRSYGNERDTYWEGYLCGGPEAPLTEGEPRPGERGGGIIKQRLKELRDLIDPKCLAFPSSKGVDAMKYLDDLIAFPGAVGTALIPPTVNPDGSVSITNAETPGRQVGEATTINTIGAFFLSSYDGRPLTTDRRRIPGGTRPAQLFILLHETAHGTEVLQHDKGNQNAVDRNDKKLEKECKDTLKRFSK